MLRSATPASPGGSNLSAPQAFTYASDELDALAGAENYYGAIVRSFAPYFGKRVLEVGAGVGTFASHVLRHAPDMCVTLVEPAENNFTTLQAKFANDERVETLNAYLGEVEDTRPLDSVVAVNVLEHVKDDIAFLRAGRRLLSPGGHILLYVPALPILFGSLDEVFEHHRRYTKSTLSNALHVAGFEISDVRYTNFPGVLSWFVSGRVLRRRTISAREVNTYDRFIMPLVSTVEKFASPPIGQSLIAIAVRR
jgi:SAM-dependent methyltransferase